MRNVPERLHDELGHFITNYGERSFENNPMHRIIAAKKSGGEWEITTTENQLAGRLARKIKNHFKGAKAQVRFLGDPSDVEEVIITF